MMNNTTEMVFIMDRSGSMSGLEKDTIGGFNSMIRRQKAEAGEALVTTYFFNQTNTLIHDRVKLGEVMDITDKDYLPGGCTALIDAIGEAVNHIAIIHKYANPEDVPHKTIFVIITDGMENASKHYSSDEVKKLIEQKKEESGWEFLFLGSNIDAVETAKSFGISKDRAVDYCCDEAGTTLNYEVLGDAVAQFSTSCIKEGWEERIVNYRKSKIRE